MMKFEKVKQLMSEVYDKDPKCPHPCWAFVNAVPHGVIETQEQYDYVKYYSDHTAAQRWMNKIRILRGR